MTPMPASNDRPRQPVDVAEEVNAIQCELYKIVSKARADGAGEQSLCAVEIGLLHRALTALIRLEGNAELAADWSARVLELESTLADVGSLLLLGLFTGEGAARAGQLMKKIREFGIRLDVEPAP